MKKIVLISLLWTLSIGFLSGQEKVKQENVSIDGDTYTLIYDYESSIIGIYNHSKNIKDIPNLVGKKHVKHFQCLGEIS